MSGVCKITARRYQITARTNNTAGQTGGYDTSCFPAKTWNIKMKMYPARYFPLRALSAALRGTQGWTAVTQKLQHGIEREQQAEAAKLDAAIAKNLEELGYGI
jgi:hypothetical protein